MNDFERSLKEHADNFQMIPSKKVWHGIYNDLHPGKRWPSVTMSLLLIFTLVVIGHLNTNNSRQVAYIVNSKSSVEKKLLSDLKKATGSTHNQRVVVRKTDLDKGREMFVYANGHSNDTPVETIVTSPPNNGTIEDRSTTDHFRPENSSGSSTESKMTLTPKITLNSDENIVASEQYNGGQLENENDISVNGNPQGKITDQVNTQPATKTLAGKNKNVNSGTVTSREVTKVANKEPGTEKKTAKLSKKRNDKIAWVYYAAPVVSSVSFSGQPLKEPQGSNFATGPVINAKPNEILHSSALGFEAGAQVNYTITKKLKFTTGAHLTYSGYNIISNEVHPLRATLILKDPGTGAIYSRSFITHYGDGTGQTVAMIRNYNWQLSVPVGLQYELIGNDKIQFNLGANLEPSLVLKSNAYILSSDANNYVTDPSLLRKINLNSNFGAFVTFRSARFKWQIGPNMRYQWMSTYLKDYTVKEHLIDYGIRIGISR